MRSKLDQIGGILVNTKLSIFLPCWFLFFIALGLQSYRFKLILAAQQIYLPILRVFRLTLIGQFFNNFLPTVVGGDAIKALYASSATNRKLESFTSVFVDRMLGLMTLMFLAVCALAVRYNQIQNKMLVLVVFIMFVISVAFPVIIFNKGLAKKLGFMSKFLKKLKLDDKLRRLYEAANKYRQHKSLILTAVALSFVAQLLCVFMVYILCFSMGSQVHIVNLLLTLPVISTVSMLPSINGLGIREGSFVYFLGPIMGAENALALSLLWLAIYLGTSLIGGVIFAFEKKDIL